MFHESTNQVQNSMYDFQMGAKKTAANSGFKWNRINREKGFLLLIYETILNNSI